MQLAPRRWFQIHLSTALVTSLAAGGAMSVFFSPSYVNSKNVNSSEFRMRNIGWPWTAACQVESVPRNRETSAEIFGELRAVKVGDQHLSYTPLAADIAVLSVMLALTMLLFEWPIRHDEAEKLRRLTRRSTKLRPSAPETEIAAAAIPTPAAPARSRFAPSIVSTLVLPFVLITLIVANTVPSTTVTATVLTKHYGWPYQALEIRTFPDNAARHEYLYLKADGVTLTSPEGWTADWGALLLNLGIAAVALLLFLFVIEGLMRKYRNAPKATTAIPSQAPPLSSGSSLTQSTGNEV